MVLGRNHTVNQAPLASARFGVQRQVTPMFHCTCRAFEAVFSDGVNFNRCFLMVIVTIEFPYSLLQVWA